MTFRLPYVTPSKRQFQQRSAPDQLHTDINFYPNPIPFNNSVLLGVTARNRLVSSDATDASEIWLFTTQTASPTIPLDMSTSRAVTYLTPPIYPNQVLQNFSTPVVNVWSTTSSNRTLPPDNFPNIALLQPVVVQSPFYTKDFSTSKATNWQPSPQYPNLVLLVPQAPVQAPFYTQDFSRPFTPVPAKTDQQSVNLNLFTNPIPFLSYDWSKPKAVKASVDPQYPNLIILQPVGAPFSQLDWSKAYSISPKASNQNDLPNLLLIQPSVPSNPLGIYGWLDWSYTKGPVIIVPDQNDLPNIVLPNTIPVPPEIIIGGGKWIEGVEALRRKAQQQAASNNIAVRQAAAVLSKMGGIARAKSLTSTQRSNIASNAAKARWK